MNELEKAEKLAARAHVTLEEAKGALELNNWDLLDAMIYLEKAGLTASAGQSQYSTSYEEQNGYINVEDTVKRQEQQTERESRRGLIQKFKELCRKGWDMACRNSMMIERKGKTPIVIPLWVLLILCLVEWELAVGAFIIMLLIGFRFSVTGSDDMSKVNDVMGQASEVAEDVKEKFNNL